MKRTLIILLSIVTGYSAVAQDKQEVIASAGGYDEATGISLSWTLGETVIPTFSNGGLTLTHGFQSQLIVTAVEENIEDLVRVTIYPNPAGDMVRIRFETPLDKQVKIYLISSQGAMVKEDFMEATTVEKELNLQGLPSGIYFLRLTKGKLINVYKVVKL